LQPHFIRNDIGLRAAMIDRIHRHGGISAAPVNDDRDGMAVRDRRSARACAAAVGEWKMDRLVSWMADEFLDCEGMLACRALSTWPIYIKV